MKVKFGEIEVVLAEPKTVYDAAAEAGVISRAVIAAKLDGEVVALTTLIEGDAEVELLTFENEDGKHVFRHTASHILAQAVKRLYPATKLTIGPAIENGFYYDFDSEVPFTPDVLKALEGEMKKIVKENLKIERFELPREEAIGRECNVTVKVVIEALVDRRTDSELCCGIKPLYRLCENVSSGVSEHTSSLLVCKGQKSNVAIALHFVIESYCLAVNTCGDNTSLYHSEGFLSGIVYRNGSVGTKNLRTEIDLHVFYLFLYFEYIFENTFRHF